MRPILFDFFGSPVYSYPLLMGLGWGIGYNIARAYWERANLEVGKLNIFFLMNFIVGWIGAKVFFLLFSASDRLIEYSQEINFWLGGGFVFYGGFVFSLIASSIFIYFDKSLDYKKIGLLTPAVAAGHAVGRVGCFLAGCCYGHQCDLPIAIRFSGQLRHPVQLYEIIGLVLLFYILRKVLKDISASREALMIYLVGYSCLRFILEFFRGDAVRGIHAGLSTSQWVSVGLVFTAAILSFKKRA